MLEFNTALDKEVLVIELEGALDSHSASDFKRWFTDKVAAGYRAFALDCLCLEYISSAGISAVIELQTYLEAQAGKMVLYQLSSETRQLLKFLKLDTKLHLGADYEDAMASLGAIKRVVKEPTPKEETPVPTAEVDMVELEEIRVTPPQKTEGEAKPAGAAQTEAATKLDAEKSTAAQSETQQGNAAQGAATQTETQQSETSHAEAKEIRLDMAAKRIISCPNCRNVLRVQAAGDYLCPACRFRFTFKGS